MDDKEYAHIISILIEDFTKNTQLYDDNTYNEDDSQAFIRQLIRITTKYNGYDINKGE